MNETEFAHARIKELFITNIDTFIMIKTLCRQAKKCEGCYLNAAGCVLEAPFTWSFSDKKEDYNA